MFFSFTQYSTEEKFEKNEVAVPNVYSEFENNDHSTVNQQLNEIVDEDMTQNNTFISNIPRDPSIDSLDEAAMQYNMITIAQVSSEDCGVPMSIFDNVFTSYFKKLIIFVNKFNVVG